MASSLQDGRKGTVGTGVFLPPSIYASACSQPCPKAARTHGTRSRSAQQPGGTHAAPPPHSARSSLDLSSPGSTPTTRALGSWCSSYGSYQAFDASGFLTDAPMGQTPPRSPYAGSASPGAPLSDAACLGALSAGFHAPIRPLSDVRGTSTAMPFRQLGSSAVHAPQGCFAPAVSAASAPAQACNSLSPYSLGLSAAPAALGSFSEPLQASTVADSLSDALLLTQLQLQAASGPGVQVLGAGVGAQQLMRLQWQPPAAASSPAAPGCILATPAVPGVLAAEVSDCQCDGKGDLDMLSAVLDMKLELLLAVREEMLAKRRLFAAMAQLGGAGMLM